MEVIKFSRGRPVMREAAGDFGPVAARSLDGT